MISNFAGVLSMCTLFAPQETVGPKHLTKFRERLRLDRSIVSGGIVTKIATGIVR